MNENKTQQVWPEAGTLAAFVVPQEPGIATVVERVIDEVVVDERKRIGVIQSRQGADELVKRVISASTRTQKKRLERVRPPAHGFVAMTDTAGGLYETQVVSLRLPAGEGTRLSEAAEDMCRENAVDGIVVAETRDDAGALENELPRLQQLARSAGVGIMFVFSQDGGGAGSFPLHLAHTFAWISEDQVD